MDEKKLFALKKQPLEGKENKVSILSKLFCGTM
jgi:hypothetical protein